jgi:hypothetical protein
MPHDSHAPEGGDHRVMDYLAVLGDPDLPLTPNG